MAKSSGLGQNFYINGYDISGDVGAVNTAASPRETLDVTAINKSAFERLLGRAGGTIEFNAFFNDAALAEHAALKGLPTTDVNILWALGTSVGSSAKAMVAKQLNYDGSRGSDGSLSFTVSAENNSVAPEWAEMLSAGKITHSSAGSNSSRDDSAQTTAGVAAFLHVFDINSGAPTVVIQDSSNDSSWGTLVSFSAVSDGAEPTSERVTATGDVERYVRITTTGTFSNAVIAVAYRRGTAQDDTGY
jgi:hypothetical protein